MPRWEVTRQPLANSNSERHLKQQLVPRKDTAVSDTERNSFSKCRAVDSQPRWGLYWDDSRPCECSFCFGEYQRERVAEVDAWSFASGRVNRPRPTTRALQQWRTPLHSRRHYRPFGPP